MLPKIIAVVALFASFAASTLAQDVNADGKITFLVPVNSQQASPGARGTLWQTQVWLHNGLSVPFSLSDCGGIIPCPGQVYQPGATDLATDGPTYGAYIFNVDAASAPRITVSARLFELAKQAQPAGVHIPVVRESDFSSDPLRFLAVDGTSKNRVAVRVFDAFRTGNGVVRLDVVSPTNVVVASTTLSLAYMPQIQNEPGFAAIYDLAAALPSVAGYARYDLVVTSLTTGMRFWALVSVTDQETQQVLLVTPD